MMIRWPLLWCSPPPVPFGVVLLLLVGVFVTGDDDDPCRCCYYVDITQVCPTWRAIYYMLFNLIDDWYRVLLTMPCRAVVAIDDCQVVIAYAVRLYSVMQFSSTCPVIVERGDDGCLAPVVFTALPQLPVDNRGPWSMVLPCSIVPIDLICYLCELPARWRCDCCEDDIQLLHYREEEEREERGKNWEPVLLMTLIPNRKCWLLSVWLFLYFLVLFVDYTIWWLWQLYDEIIIHDAKLANSTMTDTDVRYHYTFN